ncbi:DUF4124 domain-containing protein [Rugamonas apoptosis]|uniref:DUF4124 domain-containing protein n=1 Tax=Rugamonas apoptosis TaxID=2758570 RepID=A0A7W2FAH7_9BURK|nr:DUF4124 domain-containing protein [Rugamonas apoptosis]MBA5688121.1 DUF4124 domain-containing protein [Rugamonas apoptosis]
MQRIQHQRGLGLIQVAILMATLAAIAMAAMMSMRSERNLFAEALGKLTGHPPASAQGAAPGAPGSVPNAAEGAEGAAQAARQAIQQAQPARPAGVLRKCVIDGKTVLSDVDCTDRNPTSTIVKVHETRGIESPKAPKPEPAADSAPNMQDKMIEKATR